MQKPHHKSYEIYFKRKHDKARAVHFRNKKTVVAFIQKLLTAKSLTVSECHYFFTIYKKVVGVSAGLGETALPKALTASSDDNTYGVDLESDFGDTGKTLKQIAQEHPWRVANHNEAQMRIKKKLENDRGRGRKG
jgi:hypothetical protein